ncbi:MAG: mannonate dehydratase [Caldilineaceae bacterium]|nr:mannonate dehydratase [Caldilineaceae bacterium]
MQLTFRWFGHRDPASLARIRQIPGVTGIVTALYDVPPGRLLPRARLHALKAEIEAAGLTFTVLESIPVHEDIKLGRAARDEQIDIYRQNIVRLGEAGIGVLCYNFMPLFDWMRTDLAFTLADGSTTMAYDDRQLAHIADPWAAELPAYFPLDDSPENLKAAYRTIDEEALWANLAYFLAGVLPVAEEAGVRLALHPDDPPWSIFGLPRIITDEAALARVLALSASPAHGLTFCTGSLGADPRNDLPAMVRRFGPRIHFAHCRNLKRTGPRQFHETGHPRACGDVDLPAVMAALRDVNFTGPLRPDHGRMIWGETGIPGYGLYDRALGATYLLGLWEGLGA